MGTPKIVAWVLAWLLPCCALAVADAEIEAGIRASGLHPQKITVKNGQGRIDVDPANKRSYYVFTPNPSDPKGPTYLIPLSTVRYTPRNYSTPEWWNANREAIAKAREARQPTPSQDPAEVRAFLEKNDLSTNPDVFTIGEGGKISRQPLQDFLLAEYRKQGATVKLYRGSLRPTEQGQWESGVMPWGSHYYTPSAPYGWRYARKMPGPPFGELQAEGKAPLFEFALPFADFEKMVKRGELTLGVELPKSAHDRFDREGVFRDALYGNTLYLGDPTFGLEFEITATKPARQRLIQAYTGSVGAEALGAAAAEQIERGTERLRLQFPGRTEVEQIRRNVPSDLETCIVRFKEMGGKP